MKVLYFSPWNKTFINDPILNLSKTSGFKYNIDYQYGIYNILKNKYYRDMFLNRNITNTIPKKNVNFTFYPNLPKQKFNNYMPYIMSYIIKKKYKNSKIDLIHAHTLWPTGYLAYSLSKYLKIPYIITSHGMDFYRCLPNVAQNRRLKKYPESVINQITKIVNNSSKIIAVSQTYKKDILKKFPDANIDVIENSFDSNIFTNTNDKNEARKKMGININDIILLSVGSFVKTKGHIYLLEAFKQLHLKNKQIKLFLIGGGELKKKYYNFISNNFLTDHVTLIENISHNELVNFYKIADIFVFPSLSESFGVALIEAMACGLPSIATKCGGPSDIIENNVNGILIEKKNVEQISEQVTKLLSNKTQTEEISKKATKFVYENFINTETKILNLYKSILSKKRRENNV